jgi:CelD/BcsL family acetyltransferase involved in cellulose biosynthesis
MQDQRLPSVKAIAARLQAAGNQFSLRGVEATVHGTVELEGERLVVRVSRTGEVLSLAPLQRKVQWNARRKCDLPLTQAERTAHERLVQQWRGRPRPARIVGPLIQAGDEAPVLEVRTFSWQR